MSDLRPTDHGDDGTWGAKLLGWLGVSIADDGTLVGSAVTDALGGTPLLEGDATVATKDYVDAAASTIAARVTALTTDSLVATDQGCEVETTAASDVELTIPANADAAFDVGAVVYVTQMGAGTVTVVPAAGVTLEPAAVETSGQYTTVVLRQRATDEWVASGELSSREVSLLELQLSKLGLVSTNYAPSIAQGTTTSPTSQSLYGMRIGLRKGMTITDIMLLITTAAAGTSPTGAYVGIIDPDDNVVAQSANLKDSASWKSQGFQTFPLSSAYVVPEDGAYVVFLLINGTWATTSPIFLRNGGSMIDDVRFDFRQGGLTTPPANGSPVTPVATATLHIWVGCVGS